MRVNTADRYAWRKDLYDQAGDLLGESTRSGALDASTEFVTEMLPALQRAADHPDMTPELAEILSTSAVTLTYEVRTSVDVDGVDD